MTEYAYNYDLTIGVCLVTTGIGVCIYKAFVS